MIEFINVSHIFLQEAPMYFIENLWSNQQEKGCQGYNINNNKLPYLRSLKAMFTSSYTFWQKAQSILPVKEK